MGNAQARQRVKARDFDYLAKFTGFVTCEVGVTEHLPIIWYFFSASGRVLWHVHGQIPWRQDGQVERDFFSYACSSTLYTLLSHSLGHSVVVLNLRSFEACELVVWFLNFPKQGDLYQDVQHCLPNQVWWNKCIWLIATVTKGAPGTKRNI